MSDDPADWGPALRLVDSGLLMPPFVEAMFEEPGAHTIKVWVAAQPDGQLGCSGVMLFRNPDLPPLTTSDLRHVSTHTPLNQLVNAVIGQVARTSDGGRPDRDALKAAMASARRRRTEITPERLQAVARVWREGGVPAVRERLHMSQSQAYRLVLRARRDGYLDNVDPQTAGMPDNL